MLEHCKRHCDYLIVGLQTNPQLDRTEKNKPVQSTLERYFQLDAIGHVDKVIPYDTENDLLSLLHVLIGMHGENIVRFVGEDYRNKPFTGKDLNIQVVYNPRGHNFSSTELRKRVEGNGGTTILS